MKKLILLSLFSLFLAPSFAQDNTTPEAVKKWIIEHSQKGGTRVTPTRRPQIDYEQELKIVRKFLRRNNIDDLMLALSTSAFDCHRVRAVGYEGDVPKAGASSRPVSLGVENDPDGYFDPANPTRLTVPEGLSGEYTFTPRFGG